MMWWIVFMSILAIGGARPHHPTRPPHLRSKIMGGQETTIEKYPYAVQMMSRTDVFGELIFYCGGSLISNFHVLTAGHCVVKYPDLEDENANYTLPEKLCPSNIFVRVGSTKLYLKGTLHQGSEIILYPMYNILKHDIAILKLITGVSFSSVVQVAFLPPKNQKEPADAIVKVIGWGSTNTDPKDISTVLQEATIKIVNEKECLTRYHNHNFPERYRAILHSHVFCAGLLDVGATRPCHGDYGGPVVLDGAVIGIGKFASECGQSYYPDVYTRVSNYRKWIDHVIMQTTVNDSAPRSQWSLLTFILVSIHILALS